MNAKVILLSLFAAVALAELPRGWISLFPPPYANAPTIMMAMSCTSSSNCYVAGGANGVGFGVLAFDGQPNGNFTELNMPDPDMMIMALATGGSDANPHGVVGGVGFGDSLQYFVNSTTLLPSSQPFLVVTQDIRTLDGENYLVVNQGQNGESSVLFSSNYGKNFTYHTINSLMPNDNTLGRYAAIPSKTTWYVTLGGWPDNEDGSVMLNRRTKVTRDENGHHSVHYVPPTKSTNVGNATGYSCVVAKTTDAGQTWHNVMYEAKWYYPNGIDCINENHCVLVGEGFDERAGGHAWLMTDGLTFQEVLHMRDNASGQWSFMSVAFNGKSEVWIGASFASQSSSTGVLFYSQDAGQTWVEHGALQFIGSITDMTFTSDGVGFATALSIFDDSTILRYDPSGPPQTPAPVWNGNFTQISCNDTACSVECQQQSFAQNVCLQLNGGGSAVAQCTNGMLEQFVYPLSNTCQGLNQMQPMPTGVCLQDNQGGSFENFCGPPPSLEMPVGDNLLRQLRK